MIAIPDLRPEELYTAKQVAKDFLKMRGTWWLEEGARQGRLPCTMLGKTRRYSRENVLAIIAICNTPVTTQAPRSPKK